MEIEIFEEYYKKAQEEVGCCDIFDFQAPIDKEFAHLLNEPNNLETSSCLSKIAEAERGGDDGDQNGNHEVELTQRTSVDDLIITPEYQIGPSTFDFTTFDVLVCASRSSSQTHWIGRRLVFFTKQRSKNLIHEFVKAKKELSLKKLSAVINKIQTKRGTLLNADDIGVIQENEIPSNQMITEALNQEENEFACSSQKKEGKNERYDQNRIFTEIEKIWVTKLSSTSAQARASSTLLQQNYKMFLIANYKKEGAIFKSRISFPFNIKIDLTRDPFNLRPNEVFNGLTIRDLVPESIEVEEDYHQMDFTSTRRCDQSMEMQGTSSDQEMNLPKRTVATIDGFGRLNTSIESSSKTPTKLRKQRNE